MTKRPHLQLVKPELDEAGLHESAQVLSFDDLYSRYARHVAAIGFRLLGRDSELDDLVQEVFIEALKSMHSVRDPSAIKGWLSVIAVRVARRKLHMRRMRSWFFGDKESDQRVIDELVSKGASTEQRALLGAVFRVLDTVPVAERLAWTLRMIEGEPLEEVARLCDCSLATAKRRVAAAQERIEKKVNRG